MIAKRLNTAKIVDDVFCIDCGWPIIDCCVNDEMVDLHPNDDYWWYCSNQGCKNHKGESFGVHGSPNWAFRDREKFAKFQVCDQL